LLPNDIRAAVAVRSIASALTVVDNFQQFFIALVYVGQSRILLVISGYASLLDNYGMGHGIASWAIDWYFNKVANAVGITQDQFAIAGLDQYGASTKPATFFGVIAFDTGLFGFVPCVWALLSAFFWRSLRPDRARRRFLYLLPAAAWMSVFIVAVLNSQWILVCYAISYFPSESTSRSEASARLVDAPVRDVLIHLEQRDVFETDMAPSCGERRLAMAAAHDRSAQLQCACFRVDPATS
jgi:hypothetical protein